MAKALDDVRIVEVSSNLAASYAAMLLAEQGANVIRLESSSPVATDVAHGTPHYYVVNRSKRIVTFDFSDRSSRASADPLIHSADILITGFTPAQLDAHGLGHAAVSKLNPRVVAVNLSPFGNSGPYANFAAGEELVAAFSGIPASQWARSGAPVALTFPAVSYSAGILAAAAA